MVFILPTNTCFGIGCYIDDMVSYKKIYQIKWRDFKKPLAIFVDNIEKILDLNKEQINFLRNYKKPWTILVERNKVKDKEILKYIDSLPNKDIYKKLAFRQVHNSDQEKIVKKWYFFLTSANKSWEKEIKDIEGIKKIFKKEIEKWLIDLVSTVNKIDSLYPSSDIFEFVDNSIKIKYLRKN